MIHGNRSNKNKSAFNLYHTKQKHKGTLLLAYISFRDWLLTFPKRNGGNIHHIFQLYRTLKASTSCTAFELHLASFFIEILLNEIIQSIDLFFIAPIFFLNCTNTLSSNSEYPGYSPTGISLSLNDLCPSTI